MTCQFDAPFVALGLAGFFGGLFMWYWAEARMLDAIKAKDAAEDTVRRAKQLWEESCALYDAAQRLRAEQRAQQ